jgi:hypothetical protein
MSKNKGGREVRKPKQPKKTKAADPAPSGLKLDVMAKKAKATRT